MSLGVVVGQVSRQFVLLSFLLVVGGCSEASEQRLPEDVNSVTSAIVGDVDDDNVLDENDLDDDNDGILDTIEQDTSGVNLFTNGSFEVADGSSDANPAISGGSGVITLPGWTIVGDIDLGEATVFGNPDAVAWATGDQFIDLLGNNPLEVGFPLPAGTVLDAQPGYVPNGVEQTITTTTGKTYVLTFDYTGHAPDGQAADIFVNGVFVEEVIYDNATAFEDNTHSIHFVGTGADTFRLIASRAASSNGGFLVDNFVVMQYVDRDSDGDSVPDHFDLDSDNDGIFDAVEAGHSQAQTNGQLTGGVDGDGIPSSVSDGSGGVNYTPANTDGVGGINAIDLDSDGDGITDALESGGFDGDGDGNPDSCTPVTATGLCSTGGISAPTNTGPGDADYINTDSDGDGNSDTVEAFDSDSDGDADTTPSGDDDDGDGIDNAFDPDEAGSAEVTTPFNTQYDSDGNGTADWQQTCGDAYVLGTEACDDGDGNNTNACNNSCLINTGFGTCSDASDCADGTALCTTGTCTVPDTDPPTVALTNDDGNLNAGDSAEITFTFSEAPMGFASGDVVATGGNVTGLTVTANPLVYTATFTPDVNSTVDGVVSMASGVFSDAAGNANTDGADADNKTTMSVDTDPPTVALTNDDGNLNAGDSAEITFTFSEAPMGFASGDVVATGGNVTGLTVTANPLVYTATFTPDVNSTVDGVVSMASGVFSDAAGNANTDGADADNKTTMSVDTDPPTVALTNDDGNLNAGDSAEITFTFSEAPMGFASGDVVTTGGNVTGLTVTANPLVYTATFTPDVNSTVDGVVSMASGVFSDAAGNANTDGADADNKTTMSVDTDPPTVALTNDDGNLNAGDSAEITFTFSEAPMGFASGDVVATGGNVTGLTVTANPLVYTATFTPDVNSTVDGVVSMASGVFSDAAGNANTDGADADNKTTMSVDTDPPTVALTNDDGNLNAGDSAEITFTFSEAPMGFASGDVVATGGNVTGLTVTANPLVYTATFTPDVNSTVDGVVSMASGVFSDAAGNANTDGADADNKTTMSVDTDPPTVALTNDDGNLNAGDSAEITFTFSEAPMGFASGDVVATGGNVTGLTVTANPLVYTATFTPDVNSTVDGVVSMASGVFSDAAGNANTDGADADNKTTMSVDTDPPTVSGDDVGPTSNATPVLSGTTDVEDGQSVTVKNGATVVCTTMASGGEWNCTPGSALPEGTTELTVETSDIAGNAANNTFDVTIDSEAPAVAIDPAPLANQDNETSYPVSGTCDEDDGDVTVSIGGVTPSQTVTCVAADTWSTTFDVSGLSDGEDAVVIDASQTDTLGNVGDAVTRMADKDTAVPVASDDPSNTAIEDGMAVTINVIGNDDANDNATVDSVDTTNTTGTVDNNGDGTVDYTPAPGFVGVDTFTYMLCDDDAPASCSEATVTVNVLPDSDGDGVTDGDDVDDDNDGILDTLEGGGTDYSADEDNNGIADIIDANVTSCGDTTPMDGLCDSWPAGSDEDGDGVPNHLDLDSDDDGLLDALEGHDDNHDGEADATASGNDDDGDGLDDAFDPDCAGMPMGCAADGVAAPTQDTDGDDAPDFLDADSDGDGLLDRDESAMSVDVDGDMIPDYLDLDSDGDGITDAVECENPNACPDTDDDGKVDYLDTDSDDDGILDGIEGHDGDGDGQADFAPFGIDDNENGLDDAYDLEMAGGVPATTPDHDEDGVPDFRDTDDDGDGVSTALECEDPSMCADNDSDGSPDYLDADSGPVDTDGDGIPDAVECGGDVAGCADTDMDGTADHMDTDDDGDGIPTAVECTTTPAMCNSDGDIYPDHLDIDSDNDGITDSVECNMGATCEDTDMDGTPDYLDTDADGDGIVDLVEGHDADSNGVADRDPLGTDMDMDGLDDAFDTDNTGVTAPVQDTDSDTVGDWRDTDDDGDGIVTSLECTNATACENTDMGAVPDYLESDSVPTDTDMDGIPDVVECPAPGDPQVDPMGCPDTDDDMMPDFNDTDDDNDGIPTADENYDGDGDPTDEDTDMDGTPDYLDTDDDGDGVLTSSECMNAASCSDTDMDGAADYRDICGDGTKSILDIASGWEECDDGNAVDGDGCTASCRLEAAPADTDGDGIPDSVECPAPGNPAQPDTCQDSDNDMMPDFNDTDDDNDGIPTADENYDGDNDPTNQDSDMDMTPDYLDTDDDNDTVPTAQELDDSMTVGNNDLDEDGKDNWLDTDSDGDGISDGDENVDENGNGVPDYLELEGTIGVGGGIAGGSFGCTVTASHTNHSRSIPAFWMIFGLLGVVHWRRQRLH